MDFVDMAARAASRALYEATVWMLSFELKRGDVFRFMQPPAQEYAQRTANTFKVVKVYRPHQGTQAERVVGVDEGGAPVAYIREFDIWNEWVKLI